MADEIFKLDVSTVTPSIGVFNGIESQTATIAGTVSGYDTKPDVEGPIPFNVDVSSGTSMIAENITRFSERVGITASIVEAVVDNHTRLQQAVKFTGLGEDVTESSTKETTEESTTTTPAGVTTAADVAGAAGAAGAAKNASQKKKGNPLEAARLVDFELEAVKYVHIREENIADDQLEDYHKLVSDSRYIQSDDIGYVRMSRAIGADVNDSKNYYFVACDPRVGRVGDVIRFTKKDASGSDEVVECVIALNTDTEDNDHTLYFIVDEAKEPVTPSKVTDKLLEEEYPVVENLGQFEDVANQYVVSYT